MDWWTGGFSRPQTLATQACPTRPGVATLRLMNRRRRLTTKSASRNCGTLGMTVENPPELHLHLVSDATGETLNAVAKAASAQFEGVEVNEHFYKISRRPRRSPQFSDSR